MTLNNTKRPMDFVVSRFARLYPAYWTAILFTTAVVLLTGFEKFYRTPGEVLVNFTMLQRLPGLDARDVDWSYWSLYTELLFYIAMLLLFVTGQLKRIERYLAIALVAALAFHGASLAIAGAPEDSLQVRALREARQAIPYAPMFVAGICLHRLWTGTNKGAAAVLLASALATAFVTLLFEQFVSVVLAVAAFGLILTGRAGFLRSAPLVWLGGISYSLYLIHNTAGRAIIVTLERAGWSADAAIAGALAAVLASAVTINRLIEKPAQRWVRDHYKRRIAAAQPSGFAPALPATKANEPDEASPRG
jgi:peptidoglycan/LPS O-acetylase OafA/YrhL